MNESIKYPVYGVEQSNHGHLYRWVFTEENLLQELSKAGYPHEEADLIKCDFWPDLWPIGGSNSSGSYIQPLSSEEEVKAFLLKGYETDCDDPMLVEIAEGIYTIDTDDAIYNSCTSEFVKLFEIPEEELTKENSLCKEAEELISKIQKLDMANASGIDYDNPFYGESREMRLSDLEEILEDMLS